MAAITGIYDLTDSKRAEAEIARQREALAQSEAGRHGLPAGRRGA